ARYGALSALASIIALFGFGKWIGVASWPIIILIVLDAFSAYLIDVDRALLQSLRKTVSLGSVTLVWVALRFLLGVIGMALLGTAWGGLLGAVLAAAIVIAALSFILSLATAAPANLSLSLPPIRALVPVILGYVSLIAVSNLDVLLTYLLLRDSALGAYS